VKRIIYLTAVLLIGGMSLWSASDLQAQRNARYQKLSSGDQRPSQFFDFIVLPGETNETVTFASVYSFSYRYLPFKKLNSPAANKEGKAFFSPVNLIMEVFNSNENQLKNGGASVSVEQLNPAGRTFWEDSAYAETYEQTQSEQNFLYGNIGMELQPGIYTYVLQLKRGERTESRLSRTRTLRIEPYSDMEVGNVLLGEELYDNQQNQSRLKLMSMGNNVKFGSDFYAFAYIPEYNPKASYTLSVNQLNNSAAEDTSEGKQVFNYELEQKDIRQGLRPELISNDKNENLVQLTTDVGGFTYALVNIPNSTFQNAGYRLTLRDENNKTVARTTFRSMWIDMPRSLLSLDMAIDMLGYIVDDQTIGRLSEGSNEARERKFRDFWQERDPTPKTEYNELMAEYYRRIDYAYQHYSTSNAIGYESDQGRIYIRFGPPDNIERKFPTSGSTVEIWSYPNREFVFRATSGFGDFRLISE